MILRFLVLLFLPAIAVAADVREFGALGDGTDDTRAFQNAIEYADANRESVYVPCGTYRVGTLFLYSSVSLIGEDQANTILKALAPQTRWINVGYKKIGARQAHPFTGTIANLQFVPEFPVDEVIHVGRFDGATVCNCRFAAGAKVRQIAAGYNNADFLNGSPVIKTGLRIEGNYIDCTGSRCESIGCGDDCDGLTIANNRIRNQEDDLGIHRCTNVIITNNTITSTTGRIYISDSSNVSVAGNLLSYVSENVAGMGIYITAESTWVPRSPRNTTIAGNTISYGSQLKVRSSGYGVRVSGAKNTVVSANVLVNQTRNLRVGIVSLENTIIPGWVDPDGIDPDGSPQLRNCVVSNNIFSGLDSGVDVLHKLSEPAMIHGNSGGRLYDGRGGNNANYSNNNWNAIASGVR